MSVYWYLEDGIRAKDIKITYTVKKCKIMIKGEVAVDAEWAKDIYVDETEWLVSKDGKQNTL